MGILLEKGTGDIPLEEEVAGQELGRDLAIFTIVDGGGHNLKVFAGLQDLLGQGGQNLAEPDAIAIGLQGGKVNGTFYRRVSRLDRGPAGKKQEQEDNLYE